MITLDARRAALAERVIFKGLLAFALVWPIGVLTGSNPWTFYDASVYYRAGQAYLDGANLYQNLEFRQWPLVAFLCAPLALLPLRAAGAVMGALSWLAGFAGLVRVIAQFRAGEIFPTAHFQRPNPLLELDGLPLRIAWRTASRSPRLVRLAMAAQNAPTPGRTTFSACAITSGSAEETSTPSSNIIPP